MLLDLAADALDLSGATRRSLIEFEGIRDRYLPEGTPRTRAEHHKSMYALRATAMLRGAVDPALLDEVHWWQTDDVWYWSGEAFVVYARVPADAPTNLCQAPTSASSWTPASGVAWVDRSTRADFRPCRNDDEP